MVITSLVLVHNFDIWRWFIIAGIFGVLALGPVLHVAGRELFQPMPYETFLQIPLLKVGRSPSRLALYMMFALAIVAAYGMAAITQGWRWGMALTACLGALIFVEFLIAPVRTDFRFAEIPSFYDQLAQESGEGAILDVPIDLHGAQGPAETYMIYQTVHARPIVGGYISRTPKTVFALFERPFLNELRARIYADQEPYDFSDISREDALNDLRNLDVQYVIMHKNALNLEDAATIRIALEDVLLQPSFEDETLIVWQRDTFNTD